MSKGAPATQSPRAVVAIAVIIAIAILLFGNMLRETVIDRNGSRHTIKVAGLARTQVTSDLIFWSGKFSRTAPTREAAFAQLMKDEPIVKSFLKDQGVADSDVDFSTVGAARLTELTFFSNVQHGPDKFVGVNVYQTIEVHSTNLPVVEKTVAAASELISKGVTFDAGNSDYIYTKLFDLKTQLIEQAEAIARNSNSNVAGLRYAKMGMFEVSPAYSDVEVSDSGGEDTSSRDKNVL